MNPRQCGFHGYTQEPCTCAPTVVTNYQKRISGSLLDHIDIHMEVPRVDYEQLSGGCQLVKSSPCKERPQ